MALVRWEPVRELNTIQHEMNRLFNTFFDTSSGVGAGGGQGDGETGRRWLPAMDLVETPEFFVLRADLPGVGEDDVKIQVEDRILTIAGERRADHSESDQGYHRVERAWGAFTRSLTLPEGVDADAVSASFDRGVLEVRVPKPEQRKPRRVEISVGGGEPRTIDSGEEKVAEKALA